MVPALRDDLRLYPSADHRDGSPAWTLLDPARNQFFQIDWQTYLILCHWALGDPKKICDQVNSRRAVRVDEEDIKAVGEFLQRHELASAASEQGTELLTKLRMGRKRSWLTWLLHHYLFFRLPLLRCDAFVTATLPYIQWLLSRGFAFLTIIIAFVGGISAIRQWDAFVGQFVDTLSLAGLAGYLSALISVKIIHEFGHAYVAKSKGCRVPTMGVAFLVLFPMAYTDVNDAWKLRRRGDRLAVGAAGIITELYVACWATLAWSLLPDGQLREVAFLYATTTWISTVIINATPFLRFDGYFLLMDWLDTPNLHQRSFEQAKDIIRRKLFGFNSDSVEYFSSSLRRFLIIFASVTWIYRFFLFLGIAALVYYLLPKPLGPILAWIEIYWFILKPLFGELKVWVRLVPRALTQPRFYFTLLMLVVLGVVLVVPFDSRVTGMAQMSPEISRSIYSSEAAQIDIMPPRSGSKVSENQLLLQLSSPDLELKLAQLDARRELLEWQTKQASFDEQLQANLRQAEADLVKVESQVDSILEKMDKLEIRAPMSGTFEALDPDLRVGDWLSQNVLIGHLFDQSSWQVVTYLSEEEVARIAVGDSSRFLPEDPAQLPVNLRVKAVASESTRNLQDHLLVAAQGGDIEARPTDTGWQPERAIYRVTLEIVDPRFQRESQVMRGKVIISGTPQAYITPYINSALAFIVRESSF
ncbi:MAG: secretion protein HylD [Oceanospirillaceae bacterium]|nr:secretion protein HylD [Oceanospirillaceae bacterium]